MKTFKLTGFLSVLSVFALALTSCEEFHGPDVTQNPELSGFEEIELSGDLQVQIRDKTWRRIRLEVSAEEAGAGESVDQLPAPSLACSRRCTRPTPICRPYPHWKPATKPTPTVLACRCPSSRP